MVKNLFKIVIFFVAFIAIFLFFISLFIKVFFPSDRIKWVIYNTSKGYLSRETRIKSIDYGIFGDISVSDFSLSEYPDFRKGTLFSLKSLVIKPKITAFLQYKIYFNKIFIDSPKLNIRRNIKDGLNVQGIAGPLKAENKVSDTFREVLISSFLISELKLVNGEVNFSDEKNRIKNITVQNIKAHSNKVVLIAPSDFAINFELISDKTKMDCDFKVEVDALKKEIVVKEGNITCGGSSLSVDGIIYDFLNSEKINSEFSIKGDRIVFDRFSKIFGYNNDVELGSGNKLDWHVSFGKNGIKIANIR
jgi:uncharacterized protein involved in outer membrane biogenesis